MSDDTRFAIGKLEKDGTVSLCVYRQSIPNEIRARLPYQFIVEWKFSTVQPNGLPSKGEYERAVKLQNLMRTPLEGNGQAVLAIISTGNGYREWYFYCRDAQALVARFNVIVNGRDLPVELHAGCDPEWKVYDEFTSPFTNPGKR